MLHVQSRCYTRGNVQSFWGVLVQFISIVVTENVIRKVRWGKSWSIRAMIAVTTITLKTLVDQYNRNLYFILKNSKWMSLISAPLLRWDILGTKATSYCLAIVKTGLQVSLHKRRDWRIIHHRLHTLHDHWLGLTQLHIHKRTSDAYSPKGRRNRFSGPVLSFLTQFEIFNKEE